MLRDQITTVSLKCWAGCTLGQGQDPRTGRHSLGRLGLPVAQAPTGQVSWSAWPITISWSHLSTDLGPGRAGQADLKFWTSRDSGIFSPEGPWPPWTRGCCGLFDLGGGVGPAGGLTPRSPRGATPATRRQSRLTEGQGCLLSALGNGRPASRVQTQKGDPHCGPPSTLWVPCTRPSASPRGEGRSLKSPHSLPTATIPPQTPPHCSSHCPGSLLPTPRVWAQVGPPESLLLT